MEMVNNTMQTIEETVTTARAEKKPDEKPGILVQALVKIFDPESDEIFVEKRA